MIIENERWSLIPGYEQYMISDHGRVYSGSSQKLLNLQENGRGYCIIGLCNSGIRKTFRVQRLVALAFIPNSNPNELTHVNHLDKDITNNHYTNLVWVSPRENYDHAIKLNFHQILYKNGKYWKQNLKYYSK